MSFEEQEPLETDDQNSQAADAETMNNYESDIQANIVNQGNEASINTSDDHSITTININLGGYAKLESIAEKIVHSTPQDIASATSKEGRNLMEIIVEALQSQRSSNADMDDAVSKSSTVIEKLPVTAEEMDTWFYGLSEISQYTVKAVAILHGGKVQEIDQLRSELSLALKEEYVQPGTDTQSTALISDLDTYVPVSKPMQSSTELYKNTHTVFRMVNGVERIFWSDADEYGNSAFGLRVLPFCAQEASRGGWGSRGTVFRAAAQRWINTPRGDAFWRAARATGIIWRSRNIEELRSLANKWANNTNQRGWRRAASLLYGAYEFERSITINEEEQKSQVVVIINQWIIQAHSYKNGQVGCAAAYTYGLIGRDYPEHALQGLDTLLNFPPNLQNDNDMGMPERVFVALVANYMGLIWSGHLRLLLQHMVKHFEELVHGRTKPQAKDFMRYRFQRTITLAVHFNIFFLITALSTTDVQATVSLDAPLPQRLQIPDPDGRDIILVGTLNKGDDGWRSSVAKILCSAIIENKSRDVFLLLKQWTMQVLTQPDAEQKLHDNLIQFFMRMNNMLKRWGDELAQKGFGNHHPQEIYKQHFIHWSKQNDLSGNFAREVLRYL